MEIDEIGRWRWKRKILRCGWVRGRRIGEGFGENTERLNNLAIVGVIMDLKLY